MLATIARAPRRGLLGLVRVTAGIGRPTAAIGVARRAGGRLPGRSSGSSSPWSNRPPRRSCRSRGLLSSARSRPPIPTTRPPGPRPSTSSPLTPDRFADLAALVRGGRRPEVVLVLYFRFRGRDWSNSTAGREPRGARRHSPATAGRPGLVAYDDRPVGWVSLGPREEYERLACSKVLAPVDDTPVWSIVCFVVSGERAAGRGARFCSTPRSPSARARRDDPRGVSGRRRRRPRSPRRTPITARSRCSRRPGSRSSSGASTTPPARSGRSSGDSLDPRSGPSARAPGAATAREPRPPTSSVACSDIVVRQG